MARATSTRHRYVGGVLVLLSTFALVLPAVAAFSGAKLGTSSFEIDTDANLAVDGAGNTDWAVVNAVPVTGGYALKIDDPSGSGDNSFGNGSKEDTAVPSVVSGGIPPNKSDLMEFGVYKESAAGGNYLHLFWSRVQDPSGTTNMDFEFNQSTTISANGITPVRTVGDLLITYDLSKGGTVPTLSRRWWLASGRWGNATDLTGSVAIGSINTSTVPAQTSGTHTYGPYSPRTFGEASIDLDQLLGTNDCTTFGSAYLKSRSSDSFTAALKDFIAPLPTSITNCGSITITKVDEANNPLAGAAFTLFNDDGATSPGTHAADDTAYDRDLTTPGVQGASCTTTTGGTPPAATCTLSNIRFGTYWLVETTIPTGYTGAEPTGVVVSRSTPNPTVTITNARNPASLAVHKQDDATPPNPIQGVQFKLYKDLAPLGGAGKGAEDTATAYTCTTDAAGDCSITNILEPGTYWIHEENVPTGHAGAADRSVTLALGQDLTAAPFTFVNARRFKVIVLVCQESDASLVTSDVTFDAAAPPAGQTPTSVPTGIDEAALCGLTGSYVHGEVGAGAHSAAVTIP